MKKVITAIFCLVMAVGTSLAQNTKSITGFVVDQNGNPLVGAEVMATGGGATSYSDSDGSFIIETPVTLKKITISYPGMENKTISVKKKLQHTITLSRYRPLRGFISLIGTLEYSFDNFLHRENDCDLGSEALMGGIGLMGGQLGKWGWYIKGIGCGNCWDTRIQGNITAGIIKQVSSPAYLYLGGGALFGVASGFSIDLGSIFKIGNHINIVAGLNYGYSKSSVDKIDKYIEQHKYLEDYDWPIYLHLLNLNLGVGYVF